jgi:uncharacterized membrane protein YkoI
MRTAVIVLGLILVLGPVSFVAADGPQGRVPLDKVPKAVQDAVKAKFAEGKIVDAEFEEEGGTKLYKLDVQVGKDTLEVKIKPDGKILTVERTITADQLPKEVAKAFETTYPGKNIKKVARIETRGRVIYEIEFYLKGKSGADKEVQFAADGKPASVEEGGTVEVPVAKLPEKVAAALKAKFPKAEPKTAESEKVDEEVIYKVVVKDDGKDVEVTLTAAGKTVEVERAVAVKDLPKAVTAALEAKYPKAELQKAELSIKGEQETYRVTLLSAEKKTFEVDVDASGKILIAQPK